MSYNLQGNIAISLRFGNAEFPLNSLNYVSLLHIRESVKLFVPVLTLELLDSTNILDSVGVQDGLPITVSITKDGVAVQTIPFRVFSFSSNKLPGATMYHFDAYYDTPKYFMSIAANSYHSTSSAAIQQIATACGLESVVTVTNDYQLWTPPLASYASFAQYITRRGYVNTTSCMALGLNTSGILIYSNIMDAVPIGTIYTNQFVPPEKLKSFDYNCMSFSVSNMMGLNNATGGYSTYTVGQSITGSSKTAKSVTVKNNVKSPNINTAVRNIVGRQRVSYLPIDSGNVHSMYTDAVNQNKRLSRLFTVNLECVLMEPCALTLCNAFNLVAVDDKGNPDIGESGTYIITDRIINIENSHYYEKLCACRIGSNNDYYAN